MREFLINALYFLAGAISGAYALTHWQFVRKLKRIMPPEVKPIEDSLEKRAIFVAPDPILTTKRKKIWNSEENAIRLDALREKNSRAGD